MPAIAGFLLLALACVLAAYLAWRTAEAADALVQNANQRRAAISISDSLLAMEAAGRAFVLTRGTEELAAFRDADAVVNRMLASPEASSGTLLALGVAARRAQAALRMAADDAARQPLTISVGLSADARNAVAELSSSAALAVEAATSSLTDIVMRQRQLGTQIVLAIIGSLLAAALLAVLLLRNTRQHVRQLALREARLHDLSASLDERVAERTRALTEVNLRFGIALSATGVTVALQDRDLRFTWISKGEYGLSADAMVGMTDEEANPDPSMASVSALKHSVIEGGEPARREIRIVHDKIERWLDLSVQPIRDEAGTIIGIIAAAIDITRYKEQEGRIRLLMREVTHRSLNLLAVIEAIMRQTANSASTLADFQTRFSARLQSLAGSHDLLVQEDWSGASLRALVRSQLGHFADITDSKTEIVGPPLHLQPDAAQHIGLALHELASNAARFGALSVPGGKAVIAWRMVPGEGSAGERLELTWREIGGPPVVPPTKRGFGRIVIERTVARGVQGEVRSNFLPEGLHWTLTFPASFVVRT